MRSAWWTLAALGGFAGAALSGAAVGHGVAQDIEKRHPPEGRFVEADGLKLHLTEAGEGRVILMVHGASSNARDLSMPLMDDLAALGHAVAVDRPGLGWSEPFRGGDRLARHAAALAALIEAEGWAKPVIVAHSYGGAVSLRLALDRPDLVGGLVLIGPVSTAYVGDVSWYNNWAFTPVAGHLLTDIVAPIWGPSMAEQGVDRAFAPSPAPPGYAEAVGQELLFRPSAFRSNAADLAHLNEELAEQQDRYPELTTPLSVIAGERDRVVSTSRHAEELADAVAQTRLAVLPGVGHMPHYERPELVAEHVAAILAEIGDAR